MSSIIKGITDEQSVTKTQPEVQVPGYGTMPLDMLKRHVQSLSKDFNDSIQKGEFLKAAYRTEQFYNALMALAKAMKQQSKVDETHSTGTTVGSAGIGGGVGLGIDKSPIEKVIEKPLGEGELPPKAGFNKKPHKVGPGTSKDDYEYKSYIPRDRKEKGEEWAIARDVRNVNSKLGKKKPKELDTGFYKSYLSNRPVREGEVVSMQARKTPLVVAGSPYDWDIYDLRTNKMVANILGGDRHDSPLYEIRIRSSGMTPTTRMLPTYVLRAGANNNPPYKAYELVAPEGGFGKVEKSPGPGGTTKLRPDQDDMLRHLFKNLGGGKYYGYDLVLVEEGLDQYELIEKALGAKIMEIDDAMELGYTDWDPEDSSSIVYLGNKKNEGYSAGAVGGAGLGEEEHKYFGDNPHDKGDEDGQPDTKKDDWKRYTYAEEGQIYSTGGGARLGELEDHDLKSVDPDSHSEKEGVFTKNQLQTILRVTKHLKNAIGDDEDLPEWVQKNIAIAQDKIVNVMDYMISDKENELTKNTGNDVAINEKINTPGGMGQSYRKYTAGPSGTKKKKTETAIPMFTPEEKMVNANDPMSDGWRLYKLKDEKQLDEKCWDTHKQVGMKKKGGKMVPNCVPKESAIMKGLQAENESSKRK